MGDDGEAAVSIVLDGFYDLSGSEKEIDVFRFGDGSESTQAFCRGRKCCVRGGRYKQKSDREVLHIFISKVIQVQGPTSKSK